MDTLPLAALSLELRCYSFGRREPSGEDGGNADEEMSHSVLNEMIASYTEMPPNIVISHTAPCEGAKEIRGFAVQPFFED